MFYLRKARLTSNLKTGGVVGRYVVSESPLEEKKPIHEIGPLV